MDALVCSFQSTSNTTSKASFLSEAFLKGSPPTMIGKKLLGNKGAGLVQMSSLGLPVPPGFIISTQAQKIYEQKALTEDLKKQVRQALKQLEHTIGKKIANPNGVTTSGVTTNGVAASGVAKQSMPLLVSVRSGAAVSMPGMMDSILNLGLNDQVASVLAQHIGADFAYDTYARFIKSYAKIVYNVPLGDDKKKGTTNPHHTTNTSTRTTDTPSHITNTPLHTNQKPSVKKQNHPLIDGYVQQLKIDFQRQLGFEFPQSFESQLWPAIEAVFKSWHSPRAQAYRRLHHLSSEGGTAVTVQAMVFGNLDSQSATGVAFTRDPSTGEKQIYGEFLACAQGEDIVSGTRTPEPIQNLKLKMPAAYKELEKLFINLEQYYKDMQDVEFTIEQGRVWLLQTRRGQRSLAACLKIATDMVNEKLITRQQALNRVPANQLMQLLHPRLAPSEQEVCLAKGLPASPGAGVGKVVFTSSEAKKLSQQGEDVILVRFETSPEDIEGLMAAQAVLTACGGMTSHAAVVARGMGKPCVVGCQDLEIDLKQGQLCVGGHTLKSHDVISLDGGTGQVFLGAVQTTKGDEAVHDEASPYATLMGWAREGLDSSLTSPRANKSYDSIGDPSRRNLQPPLAAALGAKTQNHESPLATPRANKNNKSIDSATHGNLQPPLAVRANVDTPQDAERAIRGGAVGVGLCRTEHMFFSPERLIEMQKLILSTSLAERRQALGALLPFQRDDFGALFRVMGGRPVCVRLLDPPLHEFLPRTEHELQKLADALKLSPHVLQQRAQALKEQNPMLGHRGCRLAFYAPEIYEMQVQAIDEAMHDVEESHGNLHPPLATGGENDAPSVATPRAEKSNDSIDSVTHGNLQPPLAAEVMVPFVCDRRELLYVKNIIQAKMTRPCAVGAMIELPRAALLADEIADEADFLSFGTNDLTQTVFGFSRDDVGKFLNFYTERGYFVDPFVQLDQVGVGQLLRQAVSLARRAKPGIKLGVCGEHAGEALSVHFFRQLALDYVSCSPQRLPIAILAAAQQGLG